MLTLSKNKRPLKSSSKSSLRHQPAKVNEQLTVRINKSSSKNAKTQKINRSPQMIKLMIEELQKQLMTKTNCKNICSAQQQFNKTKRKLTKSKNMEVCMKTTEVCMKTTAGAWNKQWKSPTQNKTVKRQQPNNESIFDKTIYKSFSKINNQLQSQPHPSSQKKKLSPKPKTPTKKSSKKDPPQKQNYIFLDDNLIKFSNIQLPLFIVDNNSQVLDKSEQFSLRNDNKALMIDEKQTFMRHSKVPSMDSINSKTQRHANYIQRSFCESEESQEDIEDGLSFLRLHMFDKTDKNQAQKKYFIEKQGNRQLTGQKNISATELPKINIHQVIQLNNSVVKIQQWWRNHTTLVNNQNSIQQTKKESLQTIQTKQEESQKQIESVSEPINSQKQSQSLSQKVISSPQSNNDPINILKLRQNAAFIQFSTHQQILKELLNKNKINQSQFEHQLQVIKLQLSSELNDIEKIKNILKESAEKVESVMKRTKLDIMTVKRIVLEDGKDNQNVAEDKEMTQTVQKQDILSKIFGKIEENTQLSQKHYFWNDQIQPKLQTKIPRRYKRIKIPTYQTELQQFSNQRSSDEQNSFMSHQNTKIFNSPNTNSQQKLASPNYDGNEEQISSSENIEQEIFACEIEASPSVVCQQPSQSVFPLTANFQQLYKEYQEQQESKKQIQWRISKQLGVPDAKQGQSQPPKISINTSIVAIHKFLLNFFKFYLYYHKNDFLTNMNMPFGESIETRLMKNRIKCPEYVLQDWVKTVFYTEDDQEIVYGLRHVIPETVLDDFFDSYYEQTDIDFTPQEKTNIQLEKTHNRALFHAFNNALNFFRPYYNIGGAPYLWCSSEKSLTFFCIGEDNIQQVYEKTQIKILKTSSHLCGVIIDLPHNNYVVIDKQAPSEDVQMESPFKVMENQSRQKNLKKVKGFDDYLDCYTENFNPAYLANLEQRLKKKQLAETEQQNLQWFGNTFEEGKVSTLLNLTQLIEEIILLEECSILQNIQLQRNQKKLQQ